MNFKKFFILILILSFGSAFSFAQKKEKPPKEKKVKTPKEKTSSTKNEGEDKNLGVVFNGASVSMSAGTNIYYGDIAAYNLFPRPSQFKQHLTGAFKASIARDIKWGLGAKISFQKGSLIGTRKTGKNSSTVSFENHFYDMSLQVRYLLSDALFKKNEYNRFKLYATVGIGSMWYRSQLYDSETWGTKDYEGYIEVENTQKLAQKTLSDKVAIPQTLTIPYGLVLSYKYNYKMDIHLDFTQTSTFTDRLDAFSRDWTANDKYNYIGLGITYNFNRTADDAPKKRPKKEKDIDENNNEDNTSLNSDNIKKGIFSKNNKQKKGNDDELLNIRLKLFETQLKLFEMQYLLGK